MHKRVHAIVFILSICCLVIAGAGYIRPLLLEPARLTEAQPARAVTSHRPNLKAGKRTTGPGTGCWMTSAAGAGAAATGTLGDSERAPPSGSAEAGPAGPGSLDDGERAPSGGSSGGRRRRGRTKTASARHPAAELWPGRRRRGRAMIARARRPAAQPGPGRRRRVRSMTCLAAVNRVRGGGGSDGGAR